MIDAEKHSPATRNNNTERCKELDSLLKKRERVGELDDIVNYADLDSLSYDSADEEVIGIITMEDVIEELLQIKQSTFLSLLEEMFDEMDQYVDVQNNCTPSLPVIGFNSVFLPRVPGGCAHCKRMWQLLELHSRICKEPDACKVPLYRNFKVKIQNQSKKDEAKWNLLVSKVIVAKKSQVTE